MPDDKWHPDFEVGPTSVLAHLLEFAEVAETQLDWYHHFLRRMNAGQEYGPDEGPPATVLTREQLDQEVPLRGEETTVRELMVDLGWALRHARHNLERTMWMLERQRDHIDHGRPLPKDAEDVPF
jgi:hypothetical protein